MTSSAMHTYTHSHTHASLSSGFTRLRECSPTILSLRHRLRQGVARLLPSFLNHVSLSHSDVDTHVCADRCLIRHAHTFSLLQFNPRFNFLTGAEKQRQGESRVPASGSIRIACVCLRTCMMRLKFSLFYMYNENRHACNEKRRRRKVPSSLTIEHDAIGSLRATACGVCVGVGLGGKKSKGVCCNNR